MSLRLSVDVPPAAGLHAVLLSLARQAKRDVGRMSEAPDAHIHNLRTGMKKYRSLFRLAHESVKRRMCESILKRVRLLKDGMEGSRDDAVVFQTVRRVLGKEAVERLGLQCPHAEEDTRAPETLQHAAVELVALTESLSLDGIAAAQLKRRWRRAMKKARKAMKLAAKSGAPRHFHAWRKRTKDLWYQGSALAGFVKKAANARKPAQKLSNKLGLEHDVTLVLETVKGLTSADRATLNARCESLRSSALAA